MVDFDLIRDEVQTWPCSRIERVQHSLLKRIPLFDIEVSSICNLKCRFCPREKIVRKNDLMGEELFSKLYKWLPDKAVVMFSGLGECLLNKNIGHYIRKLKKRNISSCVVTNGILLTPEKLEDLIDCGIDQIQVSYLTADKSRYAELVGSKGDFGYLNYNLQHLSEIKPSGLRVQLNFIDVGFNCNDISAVKDSALKWGFEFFYRREHSRGGSLFDHCSNIKKNNSCFNCGTFPSLHFIASDGNILSCSNDIKSANFFGNIVNTDYMSVLNAKLKLISSGIEFEMCQYCTDDYMWYTLWNGSYEQNSPEY